jgi:hypothetical protein
MVASGVAEATGVPPRSLPTFARDYSLAIEREPDDQGPA